MELYKKFQSFVGSITLEPVFFLFMLAHGFYVIVAQSLYIDKVCRVNLNYTDAICDHIQQHETEQIEVQRYVAALQAYNAILQALPGVVYALFAGPWSDSNGRKLLIICSTFGYIFNNAVFMINSYYFYELRAEYLLFECLQDFTGGSTVFFMACYSYLSDVTSTENRTKRFAFLDGLWPIAYFLGMFLAGLIKTNLGYMYNYGLGMLTSVLAMAYTVFVVKDSTKLRQERLRRTHLKEAKARAALCSDEKGAGVTDPLNDEDPLAHEPKTKTGLIGLFDLSNIKEGFKAVFRERPNHKRVFLILMIVIFEIEIFCIMGKWSNMYLFFRKKLKWTIIEYTRYTTILGMVGVGAQYVVMPILSKYFRLRDTTILLMNVVGCIINHLVIAFATAEWQLYIGICFSILAFCVTTLGRSMISKFVEPHEVGKVFSVVGAIQALMPFAASPTFGFLYRSTVATFPSAFILLVVSVYAVLLVLIMCVHYYMDKVHKKTMREEDNI